MDCVILDDGGFLLMANHDDYTNQVCAQSEKKQGFQCVFLISITEFLPVVIETAELFYYCQKL